MSLIERMKVGLTKTRERFSQGLDDLFQGGRNEEALFEDLEGLLITSDFGLETSVAIIEEVRRRQIREKVKQPEALRMLLRQVVLEYVAPSQVPVRDWSEKPTVILVVGVNGVGKTTTIGKLAHFYRQQGRSVMLAAGDTFRAAAVEQLRLWGERCDCPVIAQQHGADSASVIFDAHNAAIARGFDLLIADTAGRLHTKVNLMEELKKVKRVLGRQGVAAPHEVWLVLDATTGQNAHAQVKRFHDDLGVSGLIITKLDGTAKGGVVVGLAQTFGLPVHFVGVGETLEDLRPFDAEQFVAALF
ncbi:MAG: signal recognition particle-docking protein FtsY [Magnetococcales bacterium]|nr:signal recognition particle-docking protein FtsY [Magnetococcales bacterium]MBF0419239.1 signal recognition particle-docking protein FtsY [Magnetococcales bacterium]